MARTNKRRTTVWAGFATFLVGSAFIGIPSCESILTTVNPCGTIFAFCDPQDIDALFGDVPDWDLDPTCTIPFACDTGESIFPETPGPRPAGGQP